MAAERSQFTIFDNQLIINYFQHIVNVFEWQFFTIDKFINENMNLILPIATFYSESLPEDLLLQCQPLVALASPPA